MHDYDRTKAATGLDASTVIRNNPEFRKAIQAFIKALNKVVERHGGAAGKAWVAVDTSASSNPIALEEELARHIKRWTQDSPADPVAVAKLVAAAIFQGL